MPLTKWSFGLTYLALLAARACFALYGTGYIHPDENFQNAEVTAGPILGLHTLETWEWQSDYPVRSFLPPLVTTGIPFALSRLLCGGYLLGLIPLVVQELICRFRHTSGGPTQD
ncbi:glycosyltransferase family 22 protein [Plicaturopsis crispa FD-325 SS-3]|nr:glycosyltransferase family 22 protein [Plicaturopsis crispa FD-325 SS-3]